MAKKEKIYWDYNKAETDVERINHNTHNIKYLNDNVLIEEARITEVENKVDGKQDKLNSTSKLDIDTINAKMGYIGNLNTRILYITDKDTKEIVFTYNQETKELVINKGGSSTNPLLRANLKEDKIYYKGQELNTGGSTSITPKMLEDSNTELWGMVSTIGNVNTNDTYRITVFNMSNGAGATWDIWATNLILDKRKWRDGIAYLDCGTRLDTDGIEVKYLMELRVGNWKMCRFKNGEMQTAPVKDFAVNIHRWKGTGLLLF